MAYIQITKTQAEDILKKDQSSILVDIRDLESFEAGHIQGAFHLSQNTLSLFLNETSKEKPVIVICYHGNSSQLLAEFLSEQGFAEVYSVIGGYEDWIND